MAEFNRDNTLPRDIVDEMKESYLNYSVATRIVPSLFTTSMPTT